MSMKSLGTNVLELMKKYLNLNSKYFNIRYKNLETHGCLNLEQHCFWITYTTQWYFIIMLSIIVDSKVYMFSDQAGLLDYATVSPGHQTILSAKTLVMSLQCLQEYLNRNHTVFKTLCTIQLCIFPNTSARLVPVSTSLFSISIYII
jgi:hypothetical protein